MWNKRFSFLHKFFSIPLSFLFAIALPFALTSCKSTPDYLIDEDKMIDLLTEVHMSEGLIDLQTKEVREDPEYGKQVMASVLNKYNVSRADYDSSLIWYSQHLSKFIRIYKHVNENLQENQERWTELAQTLDPFGLSIVGDSVNLWRISSHLVMDEARLTDFKIWTFTADSAYGRGDTLRWSMRLPELPAGEGLMASLSLIGQGAKANELVLRDGATTSWLTHDTLLTLTCAPDSDIMISQVIATLHLMKSDSTSTALRPCVVDSLRMIRIHRK